MSIELVLKRRKIERMNSLEWNLWLFKNKCLKKYYLKDKHLKELKEKHQGYRQYQINPINNLLKVNMYLS